MTQNDNAKKVETKKKKVTSETKVTVVKLSCPNCGGEEEKIIYCEECEHPMSVVEVLEKDKESLEDDMELSTGSTSTSGQSDIDSDIDGESIADNADDLEVDDLIEGGLGDIFPSDDGGEDDFGGFGGDDLSDILNALDDEE